MTPDQLDRLLRLALGGPPPPLLDALVDLGRAAGALADRFVLGPVLPFDDAVPARVYASDELDPARWEAALRAAWPGPALDRFLALAPPGTRRMVDLGPAGARVYLDDLQGVDHGLPAAVAGQLMAECLVLPGGARERLTLHRESPRALLPPALLAALDRLEALGAPGFHALRWRDGEVVALTWVTESRWQGTAERTSGILRALGPRSTWEGVRALVAEAGLVAYPDGVELPVAGTPEVHVGICSRPTA